MDWTAKLGKLTSDIGRVGWRQTYRCAPERSFVSWPRLYGRTERECREMAADQADWNLSAEAEMSAKRQVKKESDARQKHAEDDDDGLSRASKRTLSDEVSNSSHPTSATVAPGKENQNEDRINRMKQVSYLCLHDGAWNHR